MLREKGFQMIFLQGAPKTELTLLSEMVWKLSRISKQYMLKTW